jgi:uncharacterized protein (DUF736 family)
MIIGKFKYEHLDDTYVGLIGTPGGTTAVAIRPHDHGPDYLVEIETGAELGAAWKRMSSEGKPYLEVKLDSPFLAQPANCTLIERDREHVLVWGRYRLSTDAISM